MTTLQEQLQTAIAKATADSETFHSIVHGSEEQDVTTENGVVKSIAKVIAENRQTLESSIAEIVSYKNDAETSAQLAMDAAETAEQLSHGSANNIGFISVGNISSTNVQSALEELDNEKIPTSAVGSTVQPYNPKTVKSDEFNEFSKAQFFKCIPLTDAPNISWDLALNQIAIVTLGGSRILNNPTNMKDGGVYILKIKQDTTGSRALAYDTTYRFSNDEIPILTTAPNSIDYLVCISDGTNMDCIFQGNFN